MRARIEEIVELEIRPPDLESGGLERERQEAVVAAALSAVADAGHRDVSCDAGELGAGR